MSDDSTHNNLDSDTKGALRADLSAVRDDKLDKLLADDHGDCNDCLSEAKGTMDTPCCNCIRIGRGETDHFAATPTCIITPINTVEDWDRLQGEHGGSIMITEADLQQQRLAALERCAELDRENIGLREQLAAYKQGEEHRAALAANYQQALLLVLDALHLHTMKPSRATASATEQAVAAAYLVLGTTPQERLQERFARHCKAEGVQLTEEQKQAALRLMELSEDEQRYELAKRTVDAMMREGGG